MTMHEGHRKRMRERFRQGGLEGFAPHEVLELLLFYGRARGDVNGLAHALLDAFGSLQGVLEARPEQLMAVNGVGEETATLVSLMVPMFRRYAACVAEERQRLGSRDSLIDYSVTILSGWRMERFYVVCLDADLRILGQRMIAEGSLDEVHAYPRRVVEVALEMNAHSVLLCHNHPGGAAKPSTDDVNATRTLQRLLAGLGITLLDHVVVSGMQSHSMYLHGELNQTRRSILRSPESFLEDWDEEGMI